MDNPRVGGQKANYIIGACCGKIWILIIEQTLVFYKPWIIAKEQRGAEPKSKVFLIVQSVRARNY